MASHLYVTDGFDHSWKQDFHQLALPGSLAFQYVRKSELRFDWHSWIRESVATPSVTTRVNLHTPLLFPWASWERWTRSQILGLVHNTQVQALFHVSTLIESFTTFNQLFFALDT